MFIGKHIRGLGTAIALFAFLTAIHTAAGSPGIIIGDVHVDPIMLDLYPISGVTNTATMREDDAVSPAGKSRTTQIECSTDDASKVVRVEMNPATGDFSGGITNRAWMIRIHSPTNWPDDFGPTEFRVDGQAMSGDDLSSKKLARSPQGKAAGNTFELILPAAPVTQARTVEITFAEWE
jgi:hypothetical protein